MDEQGRTTFSEDQNGRISDPTGWPGKAHLSGADYRHTGLAKLDWPKDHDALQV